MFGMNKKENPPEPRPTQPRRPATATPTAPTAPTVARSEPNPTQRSAPPASPTPAPARHASKSGTHIGQTVRMQGDLTGGEDLIIDGAVEGRIVLRDHSLTIGEHGNVNAQLWAKNVKVVGKVVGDVHASERIEVAEGGSVEGDLRAPKVVLAEGAVFKGRIDMQGEWTPPTAAFENAGPDSDLGPARDPSHVDPWADPENEARCGPTATTGAATNSEAKPKQQAGTKANANDPSGTKQEKGNTKLASAMSEFDPTNP